MSTPPFLYLYYFNMLYYFLGQLLPTVFSSHAWGILHTLLEMFSYRLHHTQPHYRVQLLAHLHTLATFPQTNQNQLHLW
jgi:mediator of RNA polymerase II transcription subunit 23